MYTLSVECHTMALVEIESKAYTLSLETEGVENYDSIIVVITEKFHYERHICVHLTISQQPITIIHKSKMNIRVPIRNFGHSKFKLNFEIHCFELCENLVYFLILLLNKLNMMGHRCIVPGCKSGYDFTKLISGTYLQF